jgi:hypothetical protein
VEKKAEPPKTATRAQFNEAKAEDVKAFLPAVVDKSATDKTKVKIDAAAFADIIFKDEPAGGLTAHQLLFNWARAWGKKRDPVAEDAAAAEEKKKKAAAGTTAASSTASTASTSSSTSGSSSSATGSSTVESTSRAIIATGGASGHGGV